MFSYRTLSLAFLLLLLAQPAAGWDWGAVQQKTEEVLGIRKPLTNEEVIRGLREALIVGTKNSARRASRLDGYYKNPRIRRRSVCQHFGSFVLAFFSFLAFLQEGCIAGAGLFLVAVSILPASTEMASLK